jgi:hypothetical protein
MRRRTSPWHALPFLHQHAKFLPRNSRLAASASFAPSCVCRWAAKRPTATSAVATVISFRVSGCTAFCPTLNGLPQRVDRSILSVFGGIRHPRVRLSRIRLGSIGPSEVYRSCCSGFLNRSSRVRSRCGRARYADDGNDLHHLEWIARAEITPSQLRRNQGNRRLPRTSRTSPSPIGVVSAAELLDELHWSERLSVLS